jgi:hypothetical protein
LCNRDLLSGALGGVSPSIGSVGPLVPGGTLSESSNMEVKTPTLNPGQVPRNVIGWLRQRDGAPRLLGSKFIKQAGNS